MGFLSAAMGMAKSNPYRLLAILGVVAFIIWRLTAFISDYNQSLYDAGYTAAVSEYESAANSQVESELQKLVESQAQRIKQLDAEREKALTAARLEEKRANSLFTDLETLRSIDEPHCARVSDDTVRVLNSGAEAFNADRIGVGGG